MRGMTLLPAAGKGGDPGGWSLCDKIVYGGKLPKFRTCRGLTQEGCALSSCTAHILCWGDSLFDYPQTVR